MLLCMNFAPEYKMIAVYPYLSFRSYKNLDLLFSYDIIMLYSLISFVSVIFVK